LLNQGQGDLQASFAYEVGADNPEGITSADLDGDGRPDLATANSGSSFTEGNASVLLNTTGETETAGRTITGTERDDVLKGTKDQDIICGRGGNDRIKGTQGNDVIRGGRGDDILKGGAGKDVLWGGRGEDRLRGGGSRDSLYGGLDADRCAAGPRATTARRGARDRSKRCGRAGRFGKRLPRYRDASKNARNLCAYSGCSYAST
jgi:Ca2+-binding RTX toxin-like protein